MDPRYESPDPEIDREHRRMCSLLQDISDKISKKESVRDLLRELHKVGLDHFKNEENKMKDVNYPGYTEHKESHTRLIDIFEEMMQRYTDSPIKNYIYYRFAESWLKTHFLGLDAQFKEFLNSRVN
jgi:hemerythrin